MTYLDSSCLVSLLLEEPLSASVRGALALEDSVVVTSLAELEAEVQLKALAAGGEIRTSTWRQLQARLAAMRNLEPFQSRPLPASVFSTALRQHRRPGSVYCRTLDRIHLAALEELKIRRLMTLDRKQAKAAEALGITVVLPGSG